MKPLQILLLLFSTSYLFGINKNKKLDIESIKSMCGCMEVSFEYAETISPFKDYKFHQNYKTGGKEFAFVIEETPNKIVIQHLLIVGKNTIIKHWRQDWIYENTQFLKFEKDLSWRKKTLTKNEVKGQWSQKVYQVDDSPRYQGTGSWIHKDNKHYWESTTDAPLPRRERTKRNDYNVMNRTNRHEITSNGWVHEQDNKKINREANQDLLIVEEKGWNRYTKIDDSNCIAAKTWWENNNKYWYFVRNTWDNIFNIEDKIKLEKKVGESMLFEELFNIGDGVADKKDNLDQNISKEIYSTINKYLNKN